MVAPRFRRLFVNLSLIFGLAAVVYGIERYADHNKPPSPLAPDFKLPAIGRMAAAGGVVALADFRGKPVVVNFWASWCEICREERPQLKELGAALPGSMVGIATMDRAEAAAAAEDLVPHGYPIALDGDGVVAHGYAVDGLPQTVVVDGKGRISRRFLGALSPNDVATIVLLVRTGAADGGATPTPAP